MRNADPVMRVRPDDDEVIQIAHHILLINQDLIVIVLVVGDKEYGLIRSGADDP